MGTHTYIYICTQAIILLISRVFLTGVIHFCTQKSCISKCLWWISCSNFEPLSRIFNAQTSTKTWVGTCAHKQQLLCHSSVDSHRHLWIPTDTYGVPACCAHLPCPLALSLLCWGSVPAPDRCWGFRAGLQSAGLLCHLNCKTCLRIWAEVMASNSSVFGGTKLHPYRW